MGEPGAGAGGCREKNGAPRTTGAWPGPGGWGRTGCVSNDPSTVLRTPHSLGMGQVRPAALGQRGLLWPKCPSEDPQCFSGGTWAHSLNTCLLSSYDVPAGPWVRTLGRERKV